MICYMDMTFCSAECATVDCPRNFTDEHREKARKWWGGPGAPVAVRDFSEGCPEYVSCNQQAQVDQSVSAPGEPLQSDNHREAEG